MLLMVSHGHGEVLLVVLLLVLVLLVVVRLARRVAVASVRSMAV